MFLQAVQKLAADETIAPCVLSSAIAVFHFFFTFFRIGRLGKKNEYAEPVSFFEFPVFSICRIRKNPQYFAGFNGAPRRIRIPSLLIRSQMLYPVELWALKQVCIYRFGVTVASFFFKKMQLFYIFDKNSCKTAICRYILKLALFLPRQRTGGEIVQFS